MKHIAILFALIAATSTDAWAQDMEQKNITLTTTQTAPVGEIEYKSVTLNCDNLHGVVILIPTQLTLAEGNEGEIEVSYPAVEEPYINFDVRDGEFIIGRNGHVEIPKNSVISEHVPIKVKVSSSNIRRILANADSIVTIERDVFNPNLEICNGNALGLNANSITAEQSIEILNTGTLTCDIREWNTKLLTINNMGYLYIDGSTTANNITHNSMGIDHTELDVECQKLEIVSNGKGLICYSGTADEVNITSMGKALIRTSELNVIE